MLKTILTGCFSLFILTCLAQSSWVETDPQYTIRLETERSLSHLIKVNQELHTLTVALPRADSNQLRLAVAEQFELALRLADEILILARTEGRTKLLQASQAMGKTEYAIDNLHSTLYLVELSLALAANNNYLKPYETEKEEIKAFLKSLSTLENDALPFAGLTQWEAHMQVLNLQLRSVALANALLTEEIALRSQVIVN